MLSFIKDINSVKIHSIRVIRVLVFKYLDAFALSFLYSNFRSLVTPAKEESQSLAIKRPFCLGGFVFNYLGLINNSLLGKLIF